MYKIKDVEQLCTLGLVELLMHDYLMDTDMLCSLDTMLDDLWYKNEEELDKDLINFETYVKFQRDIELVAKKYKL